MNKKRIISIDNLSGRVSMGYFSQLDMLQIPENIQQ